MTPLAGRLGILMVAICTIAIVAAMTIEHERRLLAYIITPNTFIGEGELHLLDNRLSVPVAPVFFAAWLPRWTDDGRYLVFYSRVNERYFYDTATWTLQRIDPNQTYPPTLQTVIDWYVLHEQVQSPDGRYRITQTGDGGFAVSETCRLPLDNNIFTSPRWSPDGEALAFVTWDDRFTALEVHLVVPHTCTITQLTGGRNSIARDVNWSPDGLRLLFERDDVLYSVTPDGETITPLSQTTQATIIGWSWSPEGITYAADHDGDFDLYLLDGDRVLLDTDSEVVFPLWQP